MDGYDVVVCTDCGFAYADGIPEQATFDRYYRDISKYEHAERDGLESQYDIVRFASIANAMHEFIPSTECSILEIGCAAGGLLRNLADSGYRDVTGLDPSPACADTAKRVYGIDVVNGSLFRAAELRRRFDFIILNGVLEHIRDLGGAISVISTLLSRGGGRLYVNAPDVTRFAEFIDAPFQQFSVEHIDFFSPVSLCNLMRGRGLDCISVWQGLVHLSPSAPMPLVHGVFQVGQGCGEPGQDIQTEVRLREYVRESKKMDEALRRIIDPISSAGRSLIVWGVGTHTQRLMATATLSTASIVAFVDSNPKYQGRTLNGIPILAPCDIVLRREPILVSSRMYQREIVDQIRHGLGLQNDIIALYGSDGGPV